MYCSWVASSIKTGGVQHAVVHADQGCVCDGTLHGGLEQVFLRSRAGLSSDRLAVITGGIG